MATAKEKINTGSFLRRSIVYTLNDTGGCYTSQKQSEMPFRVLANTLLLGTLNPETFESEEVFVV